MQDTVAIDRTRRYSIVEIELREHLFVHEGAKRSCEELGLVPAIVINKSIGVNGLVGILAWT